MEHKLQIPAIHNYYSDLMLSLAYFFDNIVFDSDSIKGYQFNIGSKTFQLDYKSQVSLPSAIINYNSSELTQYHDWFIHRIELGNPFLIPILYNNTKDLTLLLQEAAYEHSVSVTINYESVMQLLEAEHRLRTLLPLNKYIEYFTFYTFYEIPQYYLNPLMFDINKDKIFNLFTKRDTITDNLVEMASVKYNPMIRLNSLGNNGINSDNRSFSLSLDFTILNPVPMYFQFDAGDVPRLIKQKQEIYIEDICLPIYENIPIIQIKYIENNNTISKYIPLLNIDKLNNFQTQFDDYLLTGTIIDKWEFYHATIESDTYSYSCSIKVLKQLETFNIYVEGPLEGHIINPVWDEGSSEITGLFIGRFNYSTVDTKDDIREPVVITIDPNTKYIQFNLKDVKLKNKLTKKEIDIENILTIPYGLLTLLNKNFSDSRLNLICDKSLLTGFEIYNTHDNKIEFVPSISNISEYGTIQSSSDVTHIINEESFTEYFSLTGCINPTTWKYSFTQIYEQEKVISYPIYALISATFDNMPKYGANYIDHLNIDMLATYKGSPVYTTTSDRYFHDFLFLKKDTENILFTVAVANTSEYIEKDCEYAYIFLTKHDDIRIKNRNLNKLFFTMIFNNQMYSNLNTDFKIVFIQKRFYCAIAIRVPIKFYTINFAKYNKCTDTFFIKIYEDRGSINAQVSES